MATQQMGERPVRDLLETMTVASLEASSLDPQSLMLVRIAALIATDAPASSYLLNLGAADDMGVEADQITGVLAGVAPIVGTARVASAVGNIAKALGFVIELAEMEADDQA